MMRWLALGILLSGCRERAADAPKPVVAASPASPTAAAARLDPLRCLELPPRGAEGANPDWPSPRNSDGTLKRLPPGAPGEAGYTVLFHHDDFGAPSMQLGLLGSEWWSWEAGGSFEPGDAFDVRVVVYRERTREALEARFPTVKAKSDYRFVSRAEALGYLDREIVELLGYQAQPDEEYDWRPTIRELEATRRVIVACLP
ncbi:MAG: hypothetical protein ABJE95_25285 [Byssovorax sp.]